MITDFLSWLAFGAGLRLAAGWAVSRYRQNCDNRDWSKAL